MKTLISNFYKIWRFASSCTKAFRRNISRCRRGGRDKKSTAVLLTVVWPKTEIYDSRRALFLW
jgi:hypothetical protein